MPDIDAIIRQGLARDRQVEASGADLRSVRARIKGAPAGSRSTRSAAWLAGATLLLGIGLVSPVGAAVSDVASNFAGYFTGGDAGAPGSPIAADTVPPGWLSATDEEGRRLLAASGGYELYVGRDHDRELVTFSFDGAEWVGSRTHWERELAGTPVFVLGSPETAEAVASHELPVFGIAASNVADVEAVYDSGGKTGTDATGGGFVLVLDGDRAVSRITALNKDGQRLGSVPLSGR